MDTSTETVIEITQEALDQIMALRDQEAIPGLALGIRISGVGSQGFIYETAFLRPEDVDEGDHVEEHSGVPVAIPQESVDRLRGSVLDLTPDTGGLVLRNPNPATPPLGDPNEELALEGSVEDRIQTLLEKRINPAIASHGGIATLIKVEVPLAYLELGGGCQGCGLAAMTLRQGIEATIKDQIPEIDEVVDVTNHDLGENPFYV
jgi:Fe/S biogenesis protein NfuA